MKTPACWLINGGNAYWLSGTVMMTAPMPAVGGVGPLWEDACAVAWDRLSDADTAILEAIVKSLKAIEVYNLRFC